MKNQTKNQTTKWTKTTWGDYELKDGDKVLYTASKGGWGWNLYEGEDILKGHLDAFETLKELKQDVLENLQTQTQA